MAPAKRKQAAVISSAQDKADPSSMISSKRRLPVVPKVPAKALEPSTYVALDDLAIGVDAEVCVLICRQWDATYLQGKYIGAAFIVSDSMGNSMLCTSRAVVAQCFVSRLFPGKIYALKNFTVSPNRDTYRVRNTDPHILMLEGNTVVKDVVVSDEGFVRYPFQLVEFEEIVPNDSMFLIDVIGCLTSTTSPKVTLSGVQFMDCHIMNERGVTVRITLWGQACTDLIAAQAHAQPTNVIISTALLSY